MFKRWIFGAASLAILVASGANPAFSGAAFDKVKQTGTLRACIKVDYPPFGMREPNGDMVGLEHDLLADIVARMEKAFGKSISVDKIPVIAANRIQFLEAGKCDMLIATMTDKASRRKLINIVEPNYYSSGVNLMARKSVKISSWEDLRGQKVCTSQGAFWNKDYRKRYNYDLIAFAGIAETEQALRDGRCIAMTTDDSLIQNRLSNTAVWGDYEMKVETQDDTSWGLAVQHGDQEFYDFMSAAVTDWHRTGLIIESAKKWGVKPPPFVLESHDKYKNQ